MIPFREALDLVLRHAPRMDAEPCRLECAEGRVLREPLRADRPFPPYDRVMMDGYALHAADLQANACFRIAGSAPAGKPQTTLPKEPFACLEVMTGAPLPVGADCIVPVESTTRDGDGNIWVSPSFQAQPGTFIHRMGSDAGENDVLCEPGVRLGSRELGVAASCGMGVLQVSRLPRITILPTGDELVAVDDSPLPHQIRQSNGHAIRTALQQEGYAATIGHPLGDETKADDLRPLFDQNDWLIFSGAVSMGARDFLPGLLAELGCTRVFHGVAQRPGKPAGFWLGPQGQAIMALPGNPVSALTGLHAFVLPALAVACGLPRPTPQLVIPASPLPALPNMNLHLPVFLDESGRAHAAPTGNSGDFIGLLKSHGFVTLPPRGEIQAAHLFTPWR